MSIKTKLNIDERDDLTKDVDDLDAAYIENLKKQGIDESLLRQFADFARNDFSHDGAEDQNTDK